MQKLCKNLLRAKDQDKILIQPTTSSEQLILPEMKPTYIKLSLDGQPPPILLAIKYMNKHLINPQMAQEGINQDSQDLKQLFDLKIYMSFTNNQPSPNDYDRKFSEKPNQIEIW